MSKGALTKIFALLAFAANTCGPLNAAHAELLLPRPGTMVRLSPAAKPPLLAGLKVYPNDPLRFEFILDKGDSSVIPARAGIQKLIKYFLASLTIPEKDLWVNLSPYEKDRIVPKRFGQTEMGRDLLAQDYLLKQITASLIYPENETGKKFWQRVYAEAAEKFGTTQIPVNTFNKVWIVPEKAVVYENAEAGTAYVVESKLKVMLEEDYLAVAHNGGQPGDTFSGRCPQAGCQANQPLDAKATQANPSTTQQVLRDIVLPKLEHEVNHGSNFSQLRQVYNSLILATWYKKKIKDSLIAQVYADKAKVAGLNPYPLTLNPSQIYQNYLEAFKKGAYNFIKEEIDPATQQPIPRKYFSGGTSFDKAALVTRITSDRAAMAQNAIDEEAMSVSVRVGPAQPARSVRPDAAMLTERDTHRAQEIVGQIVKLPGIERAKIFSSRDVSIGHRIIAMPITWYKNTRATYGPDNALAQPSETVPFLQIGPVVIVDISIFNQLDEEARTYPYLIVKDISNFSNHEEANGDLDYNGSWVSHMVGILAAMIQDAEEISDNNFVDFGAGITGIVPMVARKLGAARVILIERDAESMAYLKANVRNNFPEEDSARHFSFVEKDIRFIDGLEDLIPDITTFFVLNQPNYGVQFLTSVLKVLRDEFAVGFISGGIGTDSMPDETSVRTSAYDFQLILSVNNSRIISDIIVTRDTRGFSQPRDSTTYMVTSYPLNVRNDYEDLLEGEVRILQKERAVGVLEKVLGESVAQFLDIPADADRKTKDISFLVDYGGKSYAVPVNVTVRPETRKSIAFSAIYPDDKEASLEFNFDEDQTLESVTIKGREDVFAGFLGQIGIPVPEQTEEIITEELGQLEEFGQAINELAEYKKTAPLVPLPTQKYDEGLRILSTSYDDPFILPARNPTSFNNMGGAVLIIIEPPSMDKRYHYINSINTQSVAEIVASFQLEGNIENSEIYVLPTPLETAGYGEEKIFAALKKMGLEKKIQFLATNKTQQENLVLYGGRIYAAPDAAMAAALNLFSAGDLMAGTPLWDEFKQMNKGQELKEIYIKGTALTIERQFNDKVRGMSEDEMAYLSIDLEDRNETGHVVLVDSVKRLKDFIREKSFVLNEYLFSFSFRVIRSKKHVHWQDVSLEDRSTQGRLAGRGLMRPVFANWEKILIANFPGWEVSAEPLVAGSATDNFMKRFNAQPDPQKTGRVVGRIADTADPATLANTGGIDLNTNKLDLNVNNSGAPLKFRVDAAMLRQLQKASGLSPTIIRIQPVTVRTFLGID